MLGEVTLLIARFLGMRCREVSLFHLPGENASPTYYGKSNLSPSPQHKRQKGEFRNSQARPHPTYTSDLRLVPRGRN
jgi:hypothetical protein